MLTFEDERFLVGVEVIRKRSLVTVAVVAVAAAMFTVMGWLYVGRLALFPQEEQAGRLLLSLRAALALFL